MLDYSPCHIDDLAYHRGIELLFVLCASVRFFLQQDNGRMQGLESTGTRIVPFKRAGPVDPADD